MRSYFLRLAAVVSACFPLLTLALPGAEVAATFTSAATVPVTAAGYTATGNTVNLALNFAPPTGTSLTLVKNTGQAFIVGAFDNLAQGQAVNLTFNGVIYPFVANYYGGTGNDLVLQWANTRLLSWGENSQGNLGQNHSSPCLVPAPVVATGALAGKTILSVSGSLALCADGSLVAWGSNFSGQVGDGSTLNRDVPVLVDQSGVLAGKQVIAISTGADFSLALCADGTLAAWGANDYRQLGDGTTTNRSVPAAVNTSTGAFAGKQITDIAAGGRHSLARCSDGTLVAWGFGDYGQLGNGATPYTSVPVAVTKGTVLASKTIVALAAGEAHSMVLCSDGTLAAWGSNGWGQVGNNSAASVLTPVAVTGSGVLSGKTVIAIGASGGNSLALCSDSTLATWGDNTNGRLGNGNTTYSKLPVAVTRTGVLSGKTISRAGLCAALCSDGTLATWGDNTNGQLGNNSTTHSSVPVLVNTTALRTGEKVVDAVTSKFLASYPTGSNLALVASPPAPSGSTLAATGVGDATATLHGTVNPSGQSASAGFEYGLTSSYEKTVAATPSSVTGTAPVAVSATVAGLLPGKTYHFRLLGTSAGGTAYGEDRVFTTTAQATLAALVPGLGALLPAFDPAVSSYALSVSASTTGITLVPTVAQAGAVVTVAGTAVPTGTASGPLALTVGNNTIPVVVTAADGVTTRAYTVTVTRPPEVFAFNTAANVPVTAAAFDASGMTATFALGFAPVPGTVLTVVNNTGFDFIRGAFGKLTQGQLVELTNAGVKYRFVANYFGGTGNDLVLQWANVRPMAWGRNDSGQIGNGGMSWNGSDYVNRFLLVPAAVDVSGVLAGKTLLAVVGGGDTSLALSTDGTLAAWGAQLGNGTTSGAVVPVLVDRSGVLAGKTVAAMAVGVSHCLVLCSDGTLVTWGGNAYGQLGNNSATASSVPVLVDASGVLAGKKVVKIATMGSHNLVLCADGVLVAWGANWAGQLGNKSTTDSRVPVLVETGGVLRGRRVIEITAGGGQSLVLCADGTLAVWGRNDYGQLGLGNKIDSKVPVLMPMIGALAGKTLRTVSAGSWHSLALCTDGTLAAWGNNSSGGLGNNSTTDSAVPVAVVRSGVLSGKTVIGIAAGTISSAALCSDGRLATWGDNSTRQLGINSTSNSLVPALVSTTSMSTGDRFANGPVPKLSYHALGLVASVPGPAATTLAANAVYDQGATLNASVSANGSATAVSFEYGLTTAYGATIEATPATATGTTVTAMSTGLAGLPTGTVFHYRVVANSPGGVIKGSDQTFTTTDQATLAALTLSEGTLDPAFTPATTSYTVTVPAAVASLTVTPVATHPDAVVKINGQVVAAAAASNPLALAEGLNQIAIGVTSENGADTGSYTLRVLRVPQVFRFSAAGVIGIAVPSLRATGTEARFELGFAPPAGSVLTVVNNTGPAMIDAVFDNLAQGQAVDLIYNGATYPFVANYYGGTGNDLVLQWANTRVFTWGSDTNGELGDNSPGTTTSQVPVAVYTAGVLLGKTVTAVSAGGSHTVVLCADGTLASWGYRLGNGSWNNFGAPVAVTMTGVLAGKKVVAVAAGSGHTLALCMDGTLAGWGENSAGQVGDNSTTSRDTPVLVDRSGVLAGKVVTAIACGGTQSLALCSDGTLAAWGAGSYGQLGTGTTANSSVPVAVTMTGVLAGKTVTAIAAGGSLSFALCANGCVAAWGRGDVGQLGNGATSNSSVPVLVDQTGVLAGKTVVEVAAGTGFGVVRCADGTLAAWGTGTLLGAGGIANSNVPVRVNRAGVLAGKTVTSLAAGSSHTLVGCADGSAAAWGSDSNGQIGDSTAGSSVTAPVAVATTNLPAGSRFMTVNDGGGERTSVAMVALPPPPTAATLAATLVMDGGATLNASVQPNGVPTAVSFEYGPTTAYGITVQASPATVTGTGSKSASHVLGGLTPGATYHFRVILATASGTLMGGDMTFATTTLGTLAGLTVAPGSVFPAFDGTRTDYAVTVSNAADSLRVTPVTAYADAAVTVNGLATASGAASEPVALVVGNTTIPVVVTSGDGINTRTYQIVVTRLPETLVWAAASTVPVTAADFLAAGDAPPLALGHAPQTGAGLMVVNNTGAGPIRGAFGNLADGQRVELEYGGITYPFFVNYAGGTGNDLVLEWGNTRVMAWGWNSNGQLGDGTFTNALVPAAVSWTGELGGVAVRDAQVGFQHSLALTWDGRLVGWGNTNWSNTGSSATAFPAVIPNSEALLGKRVVAIAAGDRHNLALCSDGSLAAWGDNYRGQIGDNTSARARDTAVLVDRAGVLSDKEIVDIEAGRDSSVALCSDGTVIQWGWLSGSQFGENSNVPVSMQNRGALNGKKVVKLRAGFNNWLALCDDGTLVTWGANNSGQLGNGTAGSAYSDDRFAPAAVTMTGVLAGKTIQEIAVGSGICLVLCSDGTLVSWGNNDYGLLGNGNTTNSSVPVRVNPTGALSGKTVIRIFAGQSQCYALCSDGSMAAWGQNGYGSLGNGTTANSTVPGLVNTNNFGPGERFAWSGGPGAAYNLALVLSAMPPAPQAATLGATAVTDNGATLNAEVRPNGRSTQVTFEYGRTTAYGTTVSIAPLGGTGIRSASLPVTELSPGVTYHFRVIASTTSGTATGADQTFTTTALATLAGLIPSAGELYPAFAAAVREYAVSVPFATDAVALMPVIAQAGASVNVNGVAVDSGSASAAIPLATGNTIIPVAVTGADGSATLTYTVTVTRVPERFVFHSATETGLTVDGFAAIGNVAFELGFAPPVGCQLTVVENQGIGFIRGTFDNLRQGQQVVLDFAGISYVFVANYFGGSGNDLVLQWANTRLTGWGNNSNGQIGDSTTTNRSDPVAVTSDGVLAGRTVIAVACGSSHTLAVCADGTVAAWGANTYGQLGNNSTINSLIPVAVDLSGELAGKTVVAVAAGASHSLALCSDGTLAGWGLNTDGQLGNVGVQLTTAPVVIERLGVLDGKEIVAIAAGNYFNLALTADGLLAAWGRNNVGQLGDGGTTTRLEPVAVGEGSVLSGRQVKAIAAGDEHSLALCADGTMVGWGYNNAGQVGDGSTTTRLLPVKVPAAGALAGRQVARIAAGGMHSLAWCTDGALTAWGYNFRGELGTGGTTASAETVPLRVITTGVLAGKTIRREVASNSSSAAICSDGTLVAWGGTPTAVSTAGLTAGERFVDCFGGRGSHLMATVARPGLAVATTLAATAVGETSATLNAEVNCNGSDATVSFEYGPTTSYGFAAAAIPGSVTGAGSVAVAAELTGLVPGTSYHFRVKVVNQGGTVYGGDTTWVTGDLAGLERLVLTPGQLSPAFDDKITGYVATVPFETGSVTLAAEAKNAGSVVRINDVVTASGVASTPIELPVGNSRIPIKVRAENGGVSRIYTLTVTRLPESLVFHAADDVPITAAAIAAAGALPDISLDFAPVPGTTLTLINHTGAGEISGVFTNLAHGQMIELSFAGALYPFVADYTGGTGNDLVLRWGNTRLMAWWGNSAGQLGDGSFTRRDLPTPVLVSGVLAGKLVTAVSAGNSHVLALCADGTVAAWGTNGSGQLGVNSTSNSAEPIAVDATGVLAGKRVVRIAAGTTHNLVLCSDGTLASWGSNNIGQLGIPTGTATSLVPVEVNRLGALAGKTVTEIGVGEANSYAACSDGTVVGWGSNSWGQLGNGANIGGSVPVAVDTSGVLAGKRVVSIDGGTYFCVALCSDGTLAAWGYNSSGQLGNNSRTDSWVPVAVDRSGVLAGKTVTMISAGPNHSLARCADGTLVSWGYNGSGQLGNPVSNSSAVPVQMNTTGVLADKHVTAVAAAGIHSLGLCDDGSLVTWGPAPTAVDLTMLQPGERFTSVACGSGFNLGIVVSPQRSIATTVMASALADTGATLRGRVNANGGSTPVSFEYGLTEFYGTTIDATPSPVTGTADTEVSARISGLLPGTVYHFRVLAPGGAARGEDLSFTTTLAGTLAGLTPNSGELIPEFDPKVTEYSLTVPATATSVTLTPVAAQPAATIKINNVLTESGAASAPVDLSAGTAVVTLEVDAGDGINATHYRVTVTRLPAVFAFDAPTTVPVTAESFQVAGLNASFELRYAPLPGATLTVLRSAGGEPIQGTFANLTQGQQVILEHAGVVYRFVANYFGGKGNDLVLQWADQRLFGWGANAASQLPGLAGNQPAPAELNLVTGRSILDWDVGGSHALALLDDGSVAAWGDNSSGQLGHATPGAGMVDMSGVMTGKLMVRVAAGGSHSLALCTDGTLLAWGDNFSGQLGDSTTTTRNRPVVVSQSGVLAGRRVLALAAGASHSLVLCADGSLVAWGANSYGQLGAGTTSNSLVPVAVDMQGVFKGKQVVAIAAGNYNSFAICADGTLVGWGSNQYGEVGDNSSIHRAVPVIVSSFGELAGRAVAAITCGAEHQLALCTDGTLVAWGEDRYGELGDSPSYMGGLQRVPVLVERSGVLAGKTVMALAAGSRHSLCGNADSTMAGWGSNDSGRVGNGSNPGSHLPEEVKTNWLRPGERIVALNAASNSGTSFALVARPPQPLVETLAADSVGDASATLCGTLRPNGSDAALSFELGLTESYGTTFAATPGQAAGTDPVAASTTVTGLLPDTTYHFRMLATTNTGTVPGGDLTFTTGLGAALAGLTLDSTTLNPAFTRSQLHYGAVVSHEVEQVSVTATAATAGTTVRIEGTAVDSGVASAPVALAVGDNPIRIIVTAAAGDASTTYVVKLTRLPEVFRFDAPGDVPVTVDRLALDQQVAAFALGFAPAAGTRLMVVRNTGGTLIGGSFANLEQGQTVELSHAGVAYHFVANYRGGNGNDLVLEWAATRVQGWGANYGQIGNGTTARSKVPVPTDTGGTLSGKTIWSLAEGGGHVLALGVDGSIAAWGSNTYGQLGDASTISKLTPVAVDNSGVLAGRNVIAVAAGGNHSLALCEDGTLATWGSNGAGQLGTGNTTTSLVPVAVARSGVLAGRTIMAIAATAGSSFALCTDGTVAAWGGNSHGQLGNGGTGNSEVPVQVIQTGVLAGRTVVALAAGEDHILALCTDGTVASWGSNSQAQLGNNSAGTNRSSVPVLVDGTGVLAGKTVVAMAAGQYHNLVLCSDGSVVSWGYNGYKQLGAEMAGSFSLSYAFAPVSVIVTGALTGKTVTGVAVGESHSLALCSDGTIVAWGRNNYGQLGNDSTTDSSIPVALATDNLLAGERLVSIHGYSRSSTSLAVTAMPWLPQASTLAASKISSTFATLNGSMNPDGTTASLLFEYGLTNSYGDITAAVPALATGNGATAVSVDLAGLTPGTLYHYRLRGTTPGGVFSGVDMTFTSGTGATLASLALSSGQLYPTFDAGTTRYAVTVPFTTSSIAVTPVATSDEATVAVNGGAVASGTASGAVPLSVGNNAILVTVSTPDGSDTFFYSVVATRLPEMFEFASATAVPLRAASVVAAGQAARFSLGFVPLPGTDLKVIDHPGLEPIIGEFSNIAQGARVALDFQGNTYYFRADYHGGDGNDLVLQWTNTRVLGWGYNGSGQLGIGSTLSSGMPVSAGLGGAMDGRRIVAGACGGSHTLALCADGSLVAWGRNNYGQLGNNSSTESLIPVAVDMTGILAGRTIIAVVAGPDSSFALLADGTLAAWGINSSGQLGDGTTINRSTPVAVPMLGALAGRSLAAIACGEVHTLALCTDGTLAAWGANFDGRLGIGGSGTRLVPVAVDRTGILSGKQVASIAVGMGHNLVLCADGTLVIWGANDNGQLGIGTGTYISGVPMAVDATGVLAGKVVVAIAAGSSHSLALCADGTLTAWGRNTWGQLGNGASINQTAPVTVDRSGVLANHQLSAIFGASGHSMALADDGTLCGWGYNTDGRIGNGGTTHSPTAVSTLLAALRTGERVTGLLPMSDAQHVMAQVASPLQSATTFTATSITGKEAVLHGSIDAARNQVAVSFEYGLDESYGMTAAATPTLPAANKLTAVYAMLGGLLPGTTYHYRVVATGEGGVARGAGLTFTTLSDNALLAGLSHDGGSIDPSFEKVRFDYWSSVPFATTAVSVSAVSDHPRASVQVNGGDPGVPVDLAVGNNAIFVTVTAEDGITTRTYTLNVTRLPQEFVFNATGDMPVTANGFAAGDYPVNVTLGFAPRPGTILTMVNNTGLGFIYGRFANLAHGQRVLLTFDGETYALVANYHGGTGNDLVLQWADTQVLAWGGNGFGQIGDDSTTQRLTPTPVNATGPLSGKTISAVSAGYLHSLALSADGTLAAWGHNVYGQLGNGGSATSAVPVAVDLTGVLAGRTVVAVAAGTFHNLALCADGTLAAWGYNNHGQLGDGTRETRRTPVLVPLLGALAGKQVVAVAAGAYQSFALADDGTVAAWGYNDEGELGDGTTSASLIPVAVVHTGVLAGRQIVALAAGQYHTLGLCADGGVVAWGYNNRGQLGDASTADSATPVDLRVKGTLTGKTVVALSAGTSHSLALCDDGTLAAWGYNHSTQLAIVGITRSLVPVAVAPTAGSVAGIISGANHNLLRLADGGLLAWGDNSNGQLGDNSTANHAAAVAISGGSLPAVPVFMFAGSGSGSQHSLAVMAQQGGGLTPQESWRMSVFGSADGMGAGADLADPDRDGVPNILERAFRLNPLGPDADRLPRPAVANGEYGFYLTQPGDLIDLIYGAEWSPTMEAGSWRNLTDTGAGGEHRFAIPLSDGSCGFMRLKVSIR